MSLLLSKLKKSKDSSSIITWRWATSYTFSQKLDSSQPPSAEALISVGNWKGTVNQGENSQTILVIIYCKEPNIWRGQWKTRQRDDFWWFFKILENFRLFSQLPTPYANRTYQIGFLISWETCHENNWERGRVGPLLKEWTSNSLSRGLMIKVTWLTPIFLFQLLP